jgi:hypothetical protein
MGTNQTLAICRALSNAKVFDATGGAKPRKAANA